MNILIYAYGNHEMGMGHIYRMLNLASLLKKREHNILFLIPSWNDGIKKIAEHNWKILKIPISSFEQESAYKQLLDNYTFDCIIADALDIPKNIMKLFKEKTKLLVTLDNIGDGRFLSDMLINVLYKHKHKLKKPKIEVNSFDYLILNENFKNFHLKEKNIKKNIKKILITQGGSDNHGIMPKIIDNLKNLPKELEYNILIGPAFKNYRELSIKRSQLKINIIKNTDKPWELFYNMDLAISGGGMTIFELLCVGVPCIALTQEYKELETIKEINSLGLVQNLGLYGNLNEEELKNSIIQLKDNYNKRIKMSEKGKKLIDGCGCERIANLIENSLRVDD